MDMDPEDDLPKLIKRNDHSNILRYIQLHELREPDLVIEHGMKLLGGAALDKKQLLLAGDSIRLAALEQICLAAIDLQNHDLAEKSLNQLRLSIPTKSVRFRRLLGRCLESSGDLDGATSIYNEMLKENPSNSVARQRKYAILRAQPKKEVEAMEALNKYLEQNMSDTSAWYEMAQFRLGLADFKGAAYALEEVVLGCPLESPIHCELAEIYATIGGIDNFRLARKHMAQSLELDGSNRRAQFGLVHVSKSFLEAAANASKKNAIDDHEIEVAKELVKYGSELVLKEYQGSKMLKSIQEVMKEYTK